MELVRFLTIGIVTLNFINYGFISAAVTRQLLETTASGFACRAWCLLKIQACFHLSRRHPPSVLMTPGPGVTTGLKSESYCTVNLCPSLLLAVLKAKTRVHTAPHRRDELFFITMTQQWKVFCKVFSSQPEGKHSVCLPVFNSTWFAQRFNFSWPFGLEKACRFEPTLAKKWLNGFQVPSA